MDFVWTDGGNADFHGFSACLEDYFNRLVGGEKNRTSFIPYNALTDIHDVVIASDSSRAVGCAGFKRCDDLSAEVKRVYVREEYRGRGIGREMMRLIETRAREKGYRRLILQTREVCAEAVGLYLSLGYHRIPNYPPYQDMPLAVCYAKDI